LLYADGGIHIRTFLPPRDSNTLHHIIGVSELISRRSKGQSPTSQSENS
jgi:hypothetical protein